jgi:hypothetical protein
MSDEIFQPMTWPQMCKAQCRHTRTHTHTHTRTHTPHTHTHTQKEKNKITTPQ